MSSKQVPRNDYDRDAPEVPDQIRAILTQYSGIPNAEIVQHIKEVISSHCMKEHIPKVAKSVYGFLNINIANAPQYNDVLQDVKNGATFLDLGCCFGQVIRKLTFDGAPSHGLTGSELEPAFIGLGYELFRDREKLKATFKTGDFFSADIGGLKGQSFDYIWGGSFFHLFTWEEQIQAFSRAVTLLAPKPGSMIFGWQTGAESAKSRPHETARSGQMYSHNERSLMELASEVAEKTGVKLRTEVGVDQSATATRSQADGDWQYLRFCMVRS